MMLCIAVTALAGVEVESSLQPTEPRCQYLADPLGIDARQPTLSWKLAPTDPKARNLAQTAYRIVVASEKKLLTTGSADLWDTGKVEGRETTGLEYGGKPLHTGMTCWWQVRVWDQAGRMSNWSSPATWSMGIMEPQSWRAKWIGYDSPADHAHRDVPEGGLVLPPPRFLRHEFSVDKPVKRATAYCSALGLFELRVNGNRASEDLFMPGWTDYEKRVYYRTYDVSKLIRRGSNVVGAMLGDGWYAVRGFGHNREHYGRHTRFLGEIVLEYADGTSEVVATSPDWQANTGPILESDFLWVSPTTPAEKCPAGTPQASTLKAGNPSTLRNKFM